MKTQKQFYGRAMVARASGRSLGLLVLLAPAVLLALLLAACTADTVNINGTYKNTDENGTNEFRLSRSDSNNVTGTLYSAPTGGSLSKAGDVSGKLEGYQPIKLNVTIRLQNNQVINQSFDVLDYGNKLKVGTAEYTKQ